MKRSLLSIAIAVCCIGIASNALADGRGHERGDRGHHSHRYDRHSHKHFDKHHHKHRSKHRYDRRDDARWYAGPPPRVRYVPPRIVRWERGGRLPARYRHERYIVRDWHDRHFHRPPKGYHWVNVGSDYLLVGIATGVILQTILRD